MSRIEKLEKHNGFPIPFIVYRDEHNTPHFKVNDEKKVYQCLVEDKCSVCGEKLDGDMWLIGGPKSAFHPQGAYVDTPVHKECGVFALKNCPYMAYTKYTVKTDLEKLSEKLKGLNLVNPTMDQNRLQYFVFVRFSSFSVSHRSLIDRFIHPKRPFLEIEYWRDGIQLTKEQAEAYV